MWYSRNRDDEKSVPWINNGLGVADSPGKIVPIPNDIFRKTSVE